MSDLHLLDTGCKWSGCRIFIEAPVGARYGVANELYATRFADFLLKQAGIELVSEFAPRIPRPGPGVKLPVEGP